MPRYYFDIRRDGVTERDPDGLYLASATDARAEATTAAVEIVTDSGVDQASDFEISSGTRAAACSSRSTP